MNSPGENPNVIHSASAMHAGGAGNAGVGGDFETTLRLMASLAAPEGLEERVYAGALAAPRGGRLLSWPRRLETRGWVRSAAAAAIVLVVGGGGWGVYSRVEQGQAARAVVTPARVVQTGGFASAGVVRTPKTIPGPVVKKAEKGETPQAKNAVKGASKVQSPSAPTRTRHTRAITTRMAAPITR